MRKPQNYPKMSVAQMAKLISELDFDKVYVCVSDKKIKFLKSHEDVLLFIINNSKNDADIKKQIWKNFLHHYIIDNDNTITEIYECHALTKSSVISYIYNISNHEWKFNKLISKRTI